jgi:hypothetical protein
VSDDALADRRRATEDDYFRNRDRELLEMMHKRAERAATRERMSNRLGSTDGELLDRLEKLGLSDDSVVLVHLLPCVEISWTDGAVSGRARQIVMEAAREQGIHDRSAAERQLDAWLTIRPPQALFDEGLHAIAILLRARTTTDRDQYVQTMIERCTAIASASGGVLGFGKISTGERQVLDRVRLLLSSMESPTGTPE